MKKRALSLLMCFMLGIALFVGCKPAAPQVQTGTEDQKQEPAAKELKSAMVTDSGGVNDQSFNQSAWEGLQKAQKDFGIKASYKESKQDAEYAANLEALTDEKNDLIWGVGFKLADAIKEAADTYPEQKFAIVDFNYGSETPKNVLAVEFKEHEAGFLVGYIAGKTTKTNKVGFVGGMDKPVIQRFQYGYMAGVQYAAKEDNKKIDVISQMAESFTDDAKGRAITKQMIQQGADIVFHAAGGVGQGVIEEAKAQGKYAIGVDKDQNYLAPETVITSALKYVGKAIYDVSKELKEGKFTGGTTATFGLAEDGVGYAKPTDKVAPEVVTKTEELKQKVISGEIKVPTSKDDYEAFLKTIGIILD